MRASSSAVSGVSSDGLRTMEFPAEGLAPDRARAALEVLAGGLALEVARRGGEVAEVVDREREVEGARELQRLARVRALQPGDLVRALLQQPGQALDDHRALPGRDPAPGAALEGGAAGGDRAGGVLGGALGDPRDDLPGRGVVDGSCLGGGDLLAADDHRLGGDLGRSHPGPRTLAGASTC
jgi:hypothetical protein